MMYCHPIEFINLTYHISKCVTRTSNIDIVNFLTMLYVCSNKKKMQYAREKGLMT